ncbi:hypothetical protein C0J52_25112 [Blattella germanica]|nr:hypothetical protein C0J52_25112 [Blattella germanica]
MSTIGLIVNFLPHSLKQIRCHFLNCSGDTMSKLSKISCHWWTIHLIYNETPKKEPRVKTALLKVHTFGAHRGRILYQTKLHVFTFKIAHQRIL